MGASDVHAVEASRAAAADSHRADVRNTSDAGSVGVRPDPPGPGPVDRVALDSRLPLFAGDLRRGRGRYSAAQSLSDPADGFRLGWRYRDVGRFSGGARRVPKARGPDVSVSLHSLRVPLHAPRAPHRPVKGLPC